MQPEKVKKFLPIILVFLVLVIVSLVWGKQLWEKVLPKTTILKPTPTAILLPTKTPREKEIIAKVKTYDVSITGKAVKPKIAGIKQYDQVRFINKTGKQISIKGEDWGGVPINPELNMTQAFEEKGRFEYTIPELEPLVSGEVVVE